MSKEESKISKEEQRRVIVWNVIFALEDGNGDVVYDDKGDVEIYRDASLQGDSRDYSHLAYGLKPEDLEIHDYC